MERAQLEGVRVIHKNFRGQEKQYNPPGNRVFSIVIEDLILAAQMIGDGWNLKPLMSRDEEGVIDAYFLPVKVKYDSEWPPRIYKVSPSTGDQLLLREDTIDMLDYLDIEFVDVILNPFRWTVNENSGVKAYVQTMYAVIDENSLDVKYANVAPFDPDEE
jgi:hypothetical protein